MSRFVRFARWVFRPLVLGVAASITAILVAALSVGRAAAAIPFDPVSNDWEGCAKLVEIARDELGTARVQVVDELDYSKLGPSDGLILIHPQGSYDLDELATFMKLGGRLALIDDFGDGDRLLGRFAIARSAAPANPLHMLHGNPSLPVAKPSSAHPIVADVAMVVLNHPSVVRHAELSSLLRIPRVGGDAGPDVALAGQVGEGRLVTIADPSIFINSMMRFSGNRTMARNLMGYLLNTSGERRRGSRLVVVYGRFRERGTLGGGIAGGVRERLRGVMGAIDGVRSGGFSGGAARIVALGVVVAVGVWVAFRAGSRGRLPRVRYAAAASDAESISRGVDDPRLAPLFRTTRDRGRLGLLRGRNAASPAGCQAILGALEGAIAARDDLTSLAREAAVRKLALEAGLVPSEIEAVVRAVTRLQRISTGFEGLGSAAWKASRHEIALMGRVLAPVADSLRAV